MTFSRNKVSCAMTTEPTIQVRMKVADFLREERGRLAYLPGLLLENRGLFWAPRTRLVLMESVLRAQTRLASRPTEPLS